MSGAGLNLLARVVSTEVLNWLSFDNRRLEWISVIQHTSQKRMRVCRGRATLLMNLQFYVLRIHVSSSAFDTMKHLLAVRPPTSPIFASSGNTLIFSACKPLNNVSRPCINTAVLTD